MSLTPDEILELVDPTRYHETDTSFPHWYIVDGELVNIYNSHPAVMGSAGDNWNQYYIKETVDPDTGVVTKDLLTMNMSSQIDTSEDPGYWYIKETTDPVTGEVTKELTNQGIPQEVIDITGIWYIDGNTLTHPHYPDLVEYGSFYTNKVQRKAIVFPSVIDVGKWAFAETAMLDIYLNPECKRSSSSFPPDCVVKDWPLSIRVTSMPTKTTYNVGEDLDIDGLVAVGSLDMTPIGKDYSSYSYTMNNDYITTLIFDNTTPGEKIVTMKYKTPYSITYHFNLPEVITVI